jgi:hypothetical protein
MRAGRWEELAPRGMVPSVGRDTADGQLNFEAHALHRGSELPSQMLEDEGEGCHRWWVMEDLEHVIEEGENDDEVFWLEPLHHEAFTRDPIAAHDPVADLRQRDIHTIAVDDRYQSEIQ